MTVVEKSKKQLLGMKSHLSQIAEVVERLDDERNALLKERSALTELLEEVKQDLESIEESQAITEAKRDSLNEEYKRVYETEWTPAKAQVNALRESVGLGPLPSLQTIEEKAQSEYLEQRRRLWMAAGAGERSTTTTGDSHLERPAEDAAAPGRAPRGRPRGRPRLVRGTSSRGPGRPRGSRGMKRGPGRPRLSRSGGDLDDDYRPGKRQQR